MSRRYVAILFIGLFLSALIIIFLAASSGDSTSSSSGFTFLCSKTETDGKVTDYYESQTLGVLQPRLALRLKITDVDVRVSKSVSSGGWDTNALCDPNTLDLPASQWASLIPGSDCGAGAAFEPCDLAFEADRSGVSAITFAPSVNDRISSRVADYVKRGALLKITGQRAK